MKRLILFFLLSILVFACQKQFNAVQENYFKKEYRIPMRDGKKLFTSVYIPRDTSRTYPILLQRTPYRVGPYGADKYRSKLGPSPLFERDGYIFVYQDVRGRFMSEGTYVNMRPFIEDKSDSSYVDESSDTFDTIDWLLKHVKHHNGKVGMWGISYPGFYAAMGMLQAHPALKAVSPQAPIADWFIGDDMHHNGAFSLTLAFNFFYSFGRPRIGLTQTWPQRFDHGTEDGYQFFLDMGPLPEANHKFYHDSIPFWNDLMAHGTYDAFWQKRNILPHVKNVSPAVMIVGGWFDAEDLYGPLHIFERLEQDKQPAQRYLVMGPWSHGAWARTRGRSLGEIDFKSATSEWYQKNLEFPFFNHFLKNGPPPEMARITSFDTGLKKWFDFERWPPQNAERGKFYLSTDFRLSITPPTQKGQAGYISDPAKPVPFINKITNTWDRTYMVADQRFASLRNDVLSWQTEPLEQALTMSGPLEINLMTGSSATDCDWVVKLIDVYPDSSNDTSAVDGYTLAGYQQLIRGDIMRARFRNSYSNPQAVVPNSITPVTLKLNSIFHTFRRGHRVMLQIQSSWFPLFDRNPQTFADIYQARPEDFKAARQRVYFGPGQQSAINFFLMK